MLRQRWKRLPEGWFEPWICEWQFVHPRLNTMRLVANWGWPGWPVESWHSWHRRGGLSFSNWGRLDP
jgi:hypothetical protein